MTETKHPWTPARILVGGGIGSGKGIAGRKLARLGAMVIEADRLGHAVLERDGEVFDAVSERWPRTVVNGQIDRGALAEIVFSDGAQLAELEAMTHPPIIARISDIASTNGDLVVEIPLILDVPGDWTTVFIDVDEDTRIARTVERGVTESAVRARMANQPTRAQWHNWADQTIDNNGSIDDLGSRIDALWYGLRNTDYGISNER